eukprot:scpid33430/ scgid7575/ 
MADKSTDKVDIAILIDSELRDLIRHRGLDVPRKATRTELVAALRASQDATYNGVSLSGSDHAVSSLCSALSDLTDVVRELKAEITAMKGMEDKLHETNREVVDLKKNVQELRVDLVAVQTELAVLKSGEAALHATGGTHLAKGQTHAHTPLDETGTSTGYGAQSYAATLQSSGPPSSSSVHPRRTSPNPAQPVPQKTRVVSYYHKPPKQPSGTSDRLVAGRRVKCSAIHVGNIDPSCSADAIAKWCQKKQVEVIKCSISATKYFGLSYAHLVVPETYTAKVLDKEFWPEDFTVRKWYWETDRVAHGSNQ